MAAVGDNMSAGLGVNIGNDVQQQTYLDNYTTDHGNGPLVGVDFQTQFKMMDTGSAVAMLDLRNVYYQKVKTDTLGVGFVYRLKNSSTFGHGFHIAYDYTWYDDLDFQQVALGHESNFQGYDTRLNFYIPFGGSQNYHDAIALTNASTLTGLYGVDFTLAKKFQDVELNAGVSYNFHDDITDNITAMNLGGEYKMNSMLLAGAKYQFRDGLLSGDHGYKVYAKVPLFRGAQDAGKDRGMSAPVKRQLGVTIQYEEDKDCKDVGADTWAAYGYSWCSDSGKAKPWSDAANIKSGASSNTTFSAQKKTFKAGKVYHLAHNYAIGEVVVESGAQIILEGTLVTKKLSVNGTADRPVLISSNTQAKALATQTGMPWRKQLSNNLPISDDDGNTLTGTIIVQSEDAAISSGGTADTTARTQSYKLNSSALYRHEAYLDYWMSTPSTNANAQTTYSKNASTTNPITKLMYDAGSGTSAETTRTAGATGSVLENVYMLGTAIHGFGSDIHLKDSTVITNKPWLLIGGKSSFAGSQFIAQEFSVPYLIEYSQGAQLVSHTTVYDTTGQADLENRFTYFWKPAGDLDKILAVADTLANMKSKDQVMLNGNAFINSDAKLSIFNGGDHNAANQGIHTFMLNNYIYTKGANKAAYDSEFANQFQVYGTPLNVASSFGHRGLAVEESVSSGGSTGGLIAAGNRMYFEVEGPSGTNTSKERELARTVAAGGLTAGNLQNIMELGINDTVGLTVGSDATASTNAMPSTVATSTNIGTVSAVTDGKDRNGTAFATVSGGVFAKPAANSVLLETLEPYMAVAGTDVATMTANGLAPVKGFTGAASTVMTSTYSNNQTDIADTQPSAIAPAQLLETSFVIGDNSTLTSWTPTEMQSREIADVFGYNIKEFTAVVTENATGKMNFPSGSGLVGTVLADANTAATTKNTFGSAQGTNGWHGTLKPTTIALVAEVLKSVDTQVDTTNSKKIRKQTAVS